MSWRALIVGLALGFGLGWLAFGRAPGPDREPIVVLPGSPPASPAAPPSLQGATDASRGPASPELPVPPVDLEGVLRSGTAREVSVAAAIRRLPEARSARDWRLFKTLLEALGRADTLAADTELVRVLGDDTLTFPDAMGDDFHQWLEGSDVPGIVDATRRRLEHFAANGETSGNATHGWVDLVADHGTEEDIAWLLLKAGTHDIRDDGAVAIARSENPVAVRWMREALVMPLEERGARAGHSTYHRTLDQFVRTHGEAGFDVVAEILDRELSGTSVVTNMKLNQLFGMFGRTVPPERGAEAVRVLQGLDTEAERCAAVKAVLALRRRGIDVSGLEHILDTPLEALRRMAGGEERAGPGTINAYTAMYAVEYNSALWNEETAEALEIAGRALAGRTAAAGNMLDVAKEIRARLRSPWREE